MLPSPTLLLVIGIWVAAFCLIAGIGSLIRLRFKDRLKGNETSAPDFWFDCFWLGYGAVIATLQLWHLMLPIDYRASLGLGILGGVGVIIAVYQLRRQLVSKRQLVHLFILLIVLIPIALWIAYRALDRHMDFDSGFYHLSAIRWLNSYAIVPGLGNLHYRLAFNQSFFIFVAALNLSPYFNQGIHIANSLLMMVVLSQLLYHTLYLLRFPQKVTPYRLFNALFLPVTLYRALPQPYSFNLSSPSPDLSIFLFQEIVLLAFVRFLFSTDESPNDQQSNDNQSRSLLFFLFTLSVIGITSKLSFAAFGLSIMALTALVYVLRKPTNQNHDYREQQKTTVIRKRLMQVILLGFITSGLLGVTWIIRGIITSGYPAFPSRIGALPVDYRVPKQITKEAEDWVYSFARQPRGDMYKVLSSWDWFPGWLQRLNDPFSIFLVVLPVYIAAATLVLSLLLLVIFQRKQWKNAAFFQFGLPLIPAVISSVFWFFSAPDPRFVGSSLWLMALWGTVILWYTVTQLVWKSVRDGLTLVSTAVVICAATAVVYDGYRQGIDFANANFPVMPMQRTEIYTTQSGVEVVVSANPNDRLELWDAPLPSSPYRLPLLELRGKTLQDGFRMPDDAVIPQ